MDLSIVLACVGAGISFFGVAQYLLGVVRGGIKPRTASWIAWLTSNIILTLVAAIDGSWLAAAINLAGATSCLLVLIASLRKKVFLRPTDAVDWSCLVISIACVVSIVFIEGGLVAALLAMLANCVAATPTLRHAWMRPREEAWQLFAANGSANFLGLIGVVLVSGLELVAIAGPLIGALVNIVLMGVTLSRRVIGRSVAIFLANDPAVNS